MTKKAYLILVVIPVIAAGLIVFRNSPSPHSAALDTPQNTVSTQTTNDTPQLGLPSSSSANRAVSSVPGPQIIEQKPVETTTARSEIGAIKTIEKIITKDGKEYPLRTYKTMITPNDPSANQWWVAPNGMNSVWDIPAGSTPVKIAVIDTGFALSHQEFSGRWAINAGESGVAASELPSDLNCTDQGVALSKSCNNIDDNFDGIVDNETGATTQQNPSKLNCTAQSLPLNKSCNNIDDDNNGYVDDYRGWDFSNFDANPQAGEINPTGSGTTHGTMVAGILGATGNNGVGVAGVNWNAQILPIQAMDDNGYGDTYTVSEAVYYAADQGAQIISLSLGTSSNDPYLRQAILYALDRGLIIVAAAGNDGCNCISYPANYPEVIAVGATAPNGNPAGFSSYGAQLDILAPGQSMATSAYSAANQTSAYTTASGTSFATPFVAGLLGLAKASQPNAAWEEITGAMFENSDRKTLTPAAPRSDVLGFGSVRAHTMLDRLRTPNFSLQRYQFSGGTILGSPRSYQCENTIPASKVYELTKAGSYRYTANLRSLSKSISEGWVANDVAYSCIGLPTDTVGLLRLVDLPSEIRNLRIKQ